MGEGRNEQWMEALSSEDRGKALNTGATFWYLLQPGLIMDIDPGVMGPSTPQLLGKLRNC